MKLEKTKKKKKRTTKEENPRKFLPKLRDLCPQRYLTKTEKKLKNRVNPTQKELRNKKKKERQKNQIINLLTKFPFCSSNEEKMSLSIYLSFSN